MIDKDKQLEEVLNDPIFDCDMITIGDVSISQWDNLTPKYQAMIGEDVVAEGNDLFEVLRQVFC